METQTIERCADALYNWLSHNGLAVNPSKSEVIQFSVSQTHYIKNVATINVAGAPIVLCPSNKSFCVILDWHRTLDDPATAVSKACYFHICSLHHIRASIQDNVANRIACSMVGSRLDYCNSLLAGMSEANFAKLQCIQNTLACVLTETRRYDHVKQEIIHIMPALAKLHWLSVKTRVTFKLVTLVYNIRQTGSPPYVVSLLSNYKPIRQLCSTDKHLLAASRSRLKTSERAFHQAAVAVWNTLPLTIREC